MPDTRISGFPAATSIAAGDVIPIVQASADKKIDWALLAPDKIIMTSGDPNNPEVLFDNDGTVMLHLPNTS
jgi:hypothetical protein